MTTFFGLRGKAYSYLIDAEGTKKCNVFTGEVNKMIK